MPNDTAEEISKYKDFLSHYQINLYLIPRERSTCSTVTRFTLGLGRDPRRSEDNSFRRVITSAGSCR